VISSSFFLNSNQIFSHRIESSGYLHEIRTGSLSANETEMHTFKLPSFRILKFQKENKESWEKVRSFTFEYRDGKYKPSPDARGEYDDIIEIDS